MKVTSLARQITFRTVAVSRRNVLSLEDYSPMLYPLLCVNGGNIKF